MEINVINQCTEPKWSRYKKDFISIAQKAEQVLSIETAYSMSVIFVEPQKIHEINREFRNIDRPTDVISFALQDEMEAYEMMEESEELGDIFINRQAIIDQARDYGHSLRREVCFLFTHGLLHLLGYDHMNSADEAKMFALQDVILNDIVPKKIRQ